MRQYGASKGSLAFREALATFLSTEYGTSVDKDQVLLVVHVHTRSSITQLCGCK